MFTITINVPQDVLQDGGSVQAAMYGQLLAPYTPTTGPSAGTALPTGQWVTFTGQDYAAASDTVSAFATYTTAGAQPLDLPDVAIQAAHIVFGIGTLPPIPVIGGLPQEPGPLSTPGIYDFVELTYDVNGVLYLNTTMIDQFGIPIQIQVQPAEAALPAGAGVTMPRAQVLGNFAGYVAGNGFLQCAQDPFGKPLGTRILSPANALVANAPQGVVAGAFDGPPSTLAAGTYYYAVSALDGTGAGAAESYAQSAVAHATVTAGQAVQVSWAPNDDQPAGTAGYNVYRGTPSGGSTAWGLLGRVEASSLTGGGALTDMGQDTTPAPPPANPLATWFDAPVQAFFARYEPPRPPLQLTATDGTSDGYLYAFEGTTTADASGLPCLQLLLAAVTQAGVPVPQPPIAPGTPFNVYSPYWNTNTFDAGKPAPPAWAPYPQVPASMMVLAAEGVFADGVQQAASNLPPGVPAASAARYGTLLGSLENQIVAALVRGIATSTTLAPENWGNGTAPVQLSPALATGTSTLAPGTPYFYVVTAVNGGGETVGSLEFSATPTAGDPCVQVNWLPMSTEQATSFNVYRGTASQGESVLLASVPNTDGACAYVDGGAAGTSQTPPSYFPPGVPADLYDAFFHQPAVSLNGVAYASPYDDQGGQSSTLSVANPTSVSITLGPWGTTGAAEGGAHTAAKPAARRARG